VGFSVDGAIGTEHVAGDREMKDEWHNMYCVVAKK